jgi:general secretion pathway protein C
MLSFLQRYLRELHLLLTVLLGLALGSLAAAVLGLWLAPSAPLPQPPAAGRPAAARRPSPADYDVILRRNIFDSTNPITLSLASYEASGKAPAGAAERPGLQLLGTVVAGRRSLALIRADHEPKLYRLEEELPGGGRLHEVVRNLVRIRYPDGSVQPLALVEGSLTGVTDAASGPPGAIRTVGENRWVIPRAEAEKARSNINEVLKQARMEPRVVDGRTDGFTVHMIRPNTLLAMLGLQRGDVLLRVNGMPLDSPEKTLQIFQQLREANRIAVDLERKGNRMSFTYEIN